MTPDIFLRANMRGDAGPLRLRIDLSLSQPWTTFFGPSGSGKSTLLHALCGLPTPLACHLDLHGEDLSHTPTHRRRIALVAQQPALFPHMTVHENIQFAMGPRASTQAGATHGETVSQILERFQLAPVAKRRPTEISGGERQRTAIARAVASRPRLLLLDEALTGLQDTLRSEMLAELRRWQSETRTPILAVTHDPAEATASADEVLRLGAGRILGRGPAAEVLAPELSRLRALLS
jgi:ABC-type sulfate/molybdate transport systems ATPase subunit